MADEVEEQVEVSLNIVVKASEQSSNTKKALKRKIFETVGTLRKLFTKLKDKDTKKTKDINKLTKQVGELRSELKPCRERLMEEHGSPSRTGTTIL
jgi:chromosome segregation ATPase